jgi:hypothetical protein
MITTDALKYLPQMGLDPLRVVGCAAAQCQNSFALANGFAVEAIVAQKFSIAFFCSAGCYLNEIPSNCCARVWWDSRKSASIKSAIIVAGVSAWWRIVGGAISSARGRAKTHTSMKFRSTEI